MVLEINESNFESVIKTDKLVLLIFGHRGVALVELWVPL